MAIKKTKPYSNLVLQIRVAPISVLQIRVAPISVPPGHRRVFSLESNSLQRPLLRPSRRQSPTQTSFFKFVWHLFRDGSHSQYLGQKRILNVDPHSKPKSVDKSPAPLCHSGCPRKYRAFVASFREFVSDYKHAYDRIVEGILSVGLPHGSLPPTGWSVSFSSG